jgi:hypothetical protein
MFPPRQSVPRLLLWPPSSSDWPDLRILICGSPAGGFQIVGLFANSADAQSYAEDYSLKDWWVGEVISPGAFVESQVATASKAHL